MKKIYTFILSVLLAFSANAQSLVSIDPSSANQGETLDVTITGNNTNFTQASGTTFNQGSGTTLQFSFEQGSSTIVNSYTVIDNITLVANITVPSDVSIGTYNLTTIDNINGELTLEDAFSVTQPSLTSITPDNADQGTTVDVSIVGANTNFSQASTTVSFVNSNSEELASTVTVVDENNLTANLVIPADATTGEYTVTVDDLTTTLTFTVNEVLIPQLTSISPDNANQGTTVDVTILGENTNFTQDITTVTFINVSNAEELASTLTVVDQNTITANLVIPADATIGEYTVTVDDLTTTLKFTVNSSGGTEVIYSDDFSDPSTWVTDHDANDCSLDWEIGNVSCAGFYPIPDIESTTAANGWAMVDSDNYGGETGGSEVEDSWLTMANPVDLSDYENVVIEFETYYRSYNYEKPFIVVGIGDELGNVNWPTDLTPDYDESTNPNVFAAFSPGVDNPTANPYKVRINISSVAGGQSQVYIRFNWTGTWGYAWFVDDFKILEQADNDIVAEYAWIFEENSGGIEYGKTPLSQSAGIYEIGGIASNFGAADQTNVKLDVNISGPTSISASDSIEVLESGQDTTFSIQSPLEFEIGLYEGIFKYSSDADALGENNVLKRNFEITEDVYSIDGIGVHPEDELVLSSLGTASFADASDGFVCANEYLFTSRDTIKSVTALITSNTVPNAEVIAYVLDSVSYFSGDFGNALSMSDLYTVTAEDTANGQIEIPVIGSPWPGDGTDVLVVEPGQYYVALEMNSAGNTYDIRILDDNTVGQPAWSSTIFIPGAQVYTNGNAFAIRLNLGSEIFPSGMEEVNDNYSIFPNPSSGIVFFNFDNSDEVTLVIRDITGKLISNQTVYSNAEVDFNNYGKGIYLVDIISRKGTKTEKIVIR